MDDKSLQLVDSRGHPLEKSTAGCGSTEGSWRGPFWGIGELGNSFEMSPLEEGWQRNISPWLSKVCGAVYACKNVMAQAIATMPIHHLRILDDDSTEVVKTSPLSRVLRMPNAYQTRSDYFMNLIFDLLGHGNCYSLALRDDSQRITSLHLVPSSGTMPYINNEEGAVFYGLGQNPMLYDLNMLVPARDVMHIRLHTPQHPLVGVSPVKYASLAVDVNTAIGSNQAAFFNNMSRPSGVLTTEEKLTSEQMNALRDAWYKRSRGLAAGEVPILGWGLKWNPMTITSEDAQLIEAYRMSIEDIARVFRVPLPLIGEYNKGSTYSNTEQLISSWLATGLGFLMEHVEQSFVKLFNLPQDETVNFETDALLRTDFAGRIDGLTKAIIGGLMSPDEARRRERLPAVPGGFGAEPRVQQQVVPLSQVGQMPEAAPAPPAPAPAPAEPPDDAPVEQSLPPAVQRDLAKLELKRLMAA